MFEEVNFLEKFDFLKEKKNIINLILDKKEIEKTPLSKQNSSYYSPSIQNFYPLYNKSAKPNKRKNKSLLKKSEKRKIKLNQKFPVSFQQAAKLTKNPYRKKMPRSLQFTGLEKFKNKSKPKKKLELKSNFELSVLKSEKMSLRTTNNNFNKKINKTNEQEINLEGIKKMKKIIAKNQEKKWLKEKNKIQNNKRQSLKKKNKSNTNNKKIINSSTSIKQNSIYKHSYYKRDEKFISFEKLKNKDRLKNLKKIMYQSPLKKDNFFCKNNFKPKFLDIVKNEYRILNDENSNYSDKKNEYLIDNCDIKNSLNELTVFSSRKINNNKKNVLYLCLGGSNQDSSNVIFSYYNPNLDSWMDSPSCQYENLNKFFACKLEKSQFIIFLFGGKKFGKRLNTISKLELLDLKRNEGNEEIINDFDVLLNNEKSGFAALVYKKRKVYIAGGNDGDNILSNFENIDLKTMKKTTLSNLQIERDELSLALNKTKDYIYAIGGFNLKENKCLNSVERFNIALNKWEFIQILNTPRRAHASISTKKGVFVIGGYDGTKYLSSVEFYEENMDKWYIVSFMNISRCLHTAILNPDKTGIYVFGGFNEKPLCSVEYMSIFDKKWIDKKNMNQPLCMHSTLLLNFDD